MVGQSSQVRPVDIPLLTAKKLWRLFSSLRLALFLILTLVALGRGDFINSSPRRGYCQCGGLWMVGPIYSQAKVRSVGRYLVIFTTF